MRNRVKDHNSDDEGEKNQEDDKKEKQVKKKTLEEIEQEQLKNLPVIADSEISPAAYLF